MPTVNFDRFVLAAARYWLDMTNAEDVITTALLLVDQQDVPDALVEITALSPVDARREDLQPLIDQTLTSSGRAPLNDETAATTVAGSIASDISGERVEPYEGARQLWRLVRKIPAAEPLLSAFVHLASEWEDVPDQRAAIEDDIKQEASKIASA